MPIQVSIRLRSTLIYFDTRKRARTDKILSAGFSEAPTSVEEQLRHFEFLATRLSLRLTRANKSREPKYARREYSRSRTLPSTNTRAGHKPDHTIRFPRRGKRQGADWIATRKTT
ncbi:hypothetical protein VN97_g3209 [Penicillium thymicola]|uniref:Uncharacterized protein n=1 Tax=Penicillium thymicola TaxID=293382 RepID=A0AAI9XAH0_PENTH|nr:hypothetical protein VN97_g3209 [Penicillium thymicola]